MTNILSVKFTDEDGATGTHRYPVAEAIVAPTDALVAALVASFQTVSNAGIEKYSVVLDKIPANVVTSSNSYDAEDKMVTSFTTSVGAALRLVLPAPLRALMATTDETWAAGEAAIDTLAAAVAAVVVTAGGSAITSVKRAWRIRKNRSRR
jgi:hypothetical protein